MFKKKRTEAVPAPQGLGAGDLERVETGRRGISAKEVTKLEDRAGLGMMGLAMSMFTTMVSFLAVIPEEGAVGFWGVGAGMALDAGSVGTVWWSLNKRDRGLEGTTTTTRALAELLESGRASAARVEALSDDRAREVARGVLSDLLDLAVEEDAIEADTGGAGLGRDVMLDPHSPLGARWQALLARGEAMANVLTDLADAIEERARVRAEAEARALEEGAGQEVRRLTQTPLSVELARGALDEVLADAAAHEEVSSGLRVQGQTHKDRRSDVA
jgi:hypothetical protein